MVRKLSQGNRVAYTMSKWLCDDLEELSKITKCPMGSTAYVIHTRDTYMMDSEGVWHCVTSDKVPVECDCIEELTIWADIPLPQQLK